MRQVIVCLALFGVLLPSCGSNPQYRTDSGIVYRIIPPAHRSDTTLAGLGCVVKVRFISRVGDSVIDNNYDKLPVYASVLPPASFGYNPLEVLGYGVREGDSIITTQIVDTMVARAVFPKLSPYMHPGDQWITYLKIERIFHPGEGTEIRLRDDKILEKHRTDSLQTILGPERIAGWLRKQHIPASALGNGLFIDTLQHGQGPAADSGMTQQLRYSISTLDGSPLDSNQDTVQGHPPLLHYVIGSNAMLPVVSKVLRTLRQGDHVRVYIPAMLAMADKPFGTKGKPYDDMIFDVELVKIGE
jgi:FKBP-type peptidyl-prolyl isomerase-like protein